MGYGLNLERLTDGPRRHQLPGMEDVRHVPVGGGVGRLDPGPVGVVMEDPRFGAGGGQRFVAEHMAASVDGGGDRLHVGPAGGADGHDVGLGRGQAGFPVGGCVRNPQFVGDPFDNAFGSTGHADDLDTTRS